jgi:hypothetical protein
VRIALKIAMKQQTKIQDIKSNCQKQRIDDSDNSTKK